MRVLKTKSSGRLDIDRAAGIIRGVSIVTAGEAKGHGYNIGRDGVQKVADAINAPDGLPVNVTHTFGDSITTRVGVVRNATVSGGRCRADIYLSQAAKVCPLGDMWEFLLSLAEEQPKHLGVSIKFFDKGFNTIEGVRYIIVDEVLSVDFVDVPAANPTGLLSAITKEPKMEMIIEWAKSLGYDGDGSPESVLEFIKGQMPGPDSGEPTNDDGGAMSAKTTAAALAANERARVAGLRKLAAAHKLNETWVLNHAEKGTALAVAEQMAQELAAWRQNGVAIPMTTNISVGDDLGRNALRAGVLDAVATRFGAKIAKPHELAARFEKRPIYEVGRQYLVGLGVHEAETWSRAQITSALFSRRPIGFAQSTSDFDSILRDAFNKSLAGFYQEQPKTWTMWASERLVADYKNINVPGISTIPTPTIIREGGGVVYTTLTDRPSTYSVEMYGTAVKLTRKAVVNDDLAAFESIPAMLSAACVRLEEDIAYALLTANATVEEDGVELFHETTHKNRVTTGKAAISVTSLAKTAALIRNQKDRDAFLDLHPANLIVPVALEAIATQTTGEVDPAKSNATKNPFSGLNVISNPRLDASDPVKWYLACAPKAGGVVGAELAFLDGERVPALAEEEEFDTGDFKWRVRHSVAGRVHNYRAFACNDGA